MITTRQKIRIEKIIGIGVFFLVFSFLALGQGVALAEAADFDVDFEATPLFEDADVKPGDETTRTVTVTNLETTTDPISVAVENEFDTGLAGVMELTISDGTTVYYSGSFADFFSSIPISLGDIAGEETAVYDFTASLPSAVGNPYQNKQLGFDLIIGWDGGSSSDSPDDDPSSGGRGGGSATRTDDDLEIFNEEVESINAADSSAVLTWNTNRDATSYLVCGDTATGSFTLDTSGPLFGYQFMVPEDTTLTTDHSMIVEDLDPSTYECRPASREKLDDDFTVGDRLNFTIPETEVAGATTAPFTFADWENLSRPGSVLGANTGKGGFGAPTYDEWRAQMDAERDQREANESNDATDDQTTATGSDEGSNDSSGANGDNGLISDDFGDSGWPWFWLVVFILGGATIWRIWR